MSSIPRFQAGVYIFIFLGVTYFGYQILDDATATQGAPQDEKPPTSKPWPWESRFQASQNQLDDALLKTPEKADVAIPFGPTFHSILLIILVSSCRNLTLTSKGSLKNNINL